MKTRSSLPLLILVLVLTAASACQNQTSTVPAAQVSASITQGTATSAPAAPDLYPGAAIRFENFSIEDGLSQSTVQSILQDRQGFLWFGTEDGLNRYDGYRFTVFKPNPADPNSLSDRWISVLYEDRDGLLWIGTRLGGVNSYDPRTGYFTRYQNDPKDPASLSSDEVHAITQDAGGNIWVAADTGLNRLNPDRTFTRFINKPDDPASLSSDTVMTLLPDPSGKLWVGTSMGLDLYDPQRGSFQHFRSDPKNESSLSNDVVTSIAADGQRGLWVATYKGLNHFEPKTGVFTRYLPKQDDPSSLAYAAVRMVMVDTSGIVWAGTAVSLERLDPASGKFRHFHDDTAFKFSLSNGNIRAIYQDREGLLWVGTWGGGVNKYNPRQNRFGYYTYDPQNKPYSLSSSGLTNIAPLPGGIVWLGAYGGGLDRLDLRSGEVSTYSHDDANPESLFSNNIWAVFMDSRNTLWVATEGSLDEMIVPGTFIHHRRDIMLPDSISSDVAYVIYEDRAGRLWIGTGSGLDRYDRESGKFIHYNDGNPIPGAKVITTILEDKRGSLWVGTFADGLFRLDEQTNTAVQYTSRPGGLSNNSILDLHVDGQGRLWVATAGGGLNLYQPDQDTFTNYTERDGLPNDVIYGIAEQVDGGLWLSTNFGIARFDPQTKTVQKYTVRDGLQSNEFNMGAFAGPVDGKIFFGGIAGLTVFDPLALTTSAYSPAVALTSFSIGDGAAQKLPLADVVTLTWPQNSFEFDFAALSYSQPDKMQYAYTLENFDKAWNENGSDRNGRYTNLPGGTYRLNLRAISAEGAASQAFAPVTIQVIPPFWQTPWFIGFMAVFGLAAVYGVYQFRVSSIKKQKVELERQVGERTREIEKLFEQTKDLAIIEERNRLARELHDSAKQKAFAALAQLGTANGLIQRDVRAAQAHITEAENLVHDVIQELTFLIQEMYPLALQEKGLVTALREYVYEWENHTDIPASLNTEDERRLPLKIEQALYRITQEALANVARHSRAKQIGISLVYTPDQVTLTIVDDGIGFDIGQKPKGIGLRSIKERAESIGGSICIESAPGSGTQIEVVIPHLAA